MDEVEEFLDVKEEERRYGIESQTSDLLDELLSSVPTEYRNNKIINNIHLLINRFKELREIYSNFDEKGNAETPKFKTNNNKPLKNSLYNLNKNIKWIIPIIKNKKIYDVLKNNDIPNDTVHLTLAKSREEEYEIYEQYKSNEIPDEENKYDYYYRALSEYFKPYKNTFNKNNIIIDKIVNSNIQCINNFSENLYSTNIHKGNITVNKFVTNRYIKGLTRIHIDNIKQHKAASNIIKLTENDRIFINGFIVLPYQIVNYYKLNLPNSNILNKSQLNKINLLQSDILNDKNIILLNKIKDEYQYNINKYNEKENIDELFVYHKNTIINKLNYFYFENSSWSYDDLDKEKEYSLFR